MDLVVHIGTHKTATTSIQHFCVMNKDVLTREGYFYPKSHFSAYEHNFLPDRLSRGDTEFVHRFMSDAVRDATALGCHTVVISAESFYAMTGFFLTPRVKKGSGLLVAFTREYEYWDKERELISSFQKICADLFRSVRLVCYIRPQDEFAFSIYNQFVKNVFGLSADFTETVERMIEIFDYQRHLDIWSDVFGQDCLSVYGFNECKHNILEHFCSYHLSLVCYERAGRNNFVSNTRLTRDVLEARRKYLMADYDISSALVTARAFIGLCEKYPDESEADQIYGDVDFRNKFFSQFQNGNRDIFSRFGVKNFDGFQKIQSTYQGLSDDTYSQIVESVVKDVSRPSRLTLIYLKRVYRKGAFLFPFIKTLVTPLKSCLYNLKLNKFGW